jgi:hypothetical protein
MSGEDRIVRATTGAARQRIIAERGDGFGHTTTTGTRPIKGAFERIKPVECAKTHRSSDPLYSGCNWEAEKKANFYHRLGSVA